MSAEYAQANEKLLSSFYAIVQASIPDFKDVAEWKTFSHALTFKLYRHLFTISELCVPTIDRITGNPYVDVASIKVIERSAFENYLVFWHIYGSGREELSKLRFNVWKYCGLHARQKLKPETSDYDAQLEAERSQMALLWGLIEASPEYSNAYTKGQWLRLRDGEWLAVNKMDGLAKNAEIYFYYEKMYKHTSGYGHTGYISAMQVGQASIEIQIRLAAISLGTTSVIIAHFLSLLCDLSPAALAFVKSDPDVERLLSFWHIKEKDWREATVGNGWPEE